MSIWKPMASAPDTEGPVILKAGDDVGPATRSSEGDWYFFDVENPENFRYAHAPEGWMPYPRSPEEAAQRLSEAEAWAQEPQREIAAAVAHRDAIQRELAQIEAGERDAQRKTAQRQADERDREAEAERLRQLRSLLPGGDA